jgi:1,4-dihydroxy-2-naphthoate octaprenyltransferase
MLSASGILMGSFLAAEQGYSRHAVFAFAMLTALCLQILSNLSNDYGDFKTGVDNPERLGPLRGVQSGKITEHQMKLAIVVFALSSLFLGLCSYL